MLRELNDIEMEEASGGFRFHFGGIIIPNFFPLSDPTLPAQNPPPQPPPPSNPSIDFRDPPSSGGAVRSLGILDFAGGGGGNNLPVFYHISVH